MHLRRSADDQCTRRTRHGAPPPTPTPDYTIPDGPRAEIYSPPGTRQPRAQDRTQREGLSRPCLRLAPRRSSPRISAPP
eukprot:7667805-Pyramimonas_sp.AAC.2